MADTILLFHMDEPDGVHPSDACGNLDDLGVEAGIAFPVSVSTWSGLGRQFTTASTHAMVAADLADQDTLLVRDVTIQAIVALNSLGAGVQTLIARGLNDGGASERYAYGLELEQQPSPFTGTVEVRWFWQNSSGTIKTQPGGVYQHPGTGKFFLLTATRRWESTSKVVVRYFINDQLIAELETADGDIAGGTTGHTSVGARKASGSWSRFLNGTIDELAVMDFEMSPEEVREVYRRLTVHQPAGVDMFAGLAPPGLGWYKDPGNDLGRHVKVAGQALGLSIAAAEELRALWLPDASPLGQIERWEALCGLAPRPRDSLDVRRTRVVSYLAREEGFSLPSVEVALAGPFALDVDDVAILEYTNEVTDDFTALDTATKWTSDGPGAWTIVTSQLHVKVDATADVRWETNGLGPDLRIPLDTQGGRLFVSGTLVSYSLPSNAGTGLLLQNRRTGDAIWFGVFNNAGTTQIGYRKVLAGVLGAWVSFGAAAANYWLRIATPQTVDDFEALPDEIRMSYSTTGPSTGFTDQVVSTGLLDLDWASFSVFGTSASLAADATANWDDFRSMCPDGLRPFFWYAFRDPLLAGTPDMIGGHLTVQKIKPAHTYATACQSVSVLCDDARDGLCDRGPLGGW